MKTKVSNFTEFRAYYLSEFELYDGEAFITFNIVGIDLARDEVQVAVTDRGKISVVTYDLMTDKNGRLYFEYGVMFERVYLDEFEEAVYAPSELFGDKWDKEDPLAQDDYNQNLLAWFGFEETLRNIGYNFETLENCI